MIEEMKQNRILSTFTRTTALIEFASDYLQMFDTTKEGAICIHQKEKSCLLDIIYIRFANKYK